MDNVPLLESVIADAMDARLDRVATAEIGQIVSYDSSKRTATVQVLGTFRHVGEDGSVVKEQIAPLSAVPVARIMGGVFRLALPPKPGDQGLVIVCSNPIGNWKVVGGAYDPGLIGRNHSLEGAVFIPCLVPMQPSSPEIIDDDAAVLGSASGMKVRVATDTVEIGNPSSSENVGTVTDLSNLAGLMQDLATFLPALSTYVIAVIAAAGGPTTAAEKALGEAAAAYFETNPVPGSSAVKASR